MSIGSKVVAINGSSIPAGVQLPTGDHVMVPPLHELVLDISGRCQLRSMTVVGAALSGAGGGDSSEGTFTMGAGDAQLRSMTVVGAGGGDRGEGTFTTGAGGALMPRTLREASVSPGSCVFHADRIAAVKTRDGWQSVKTHEEGLTVFKRVCQDLVARETLITATLMAPKATVETDPNLLPPDPVGAFSGPEEQASTPPLARTSPAIVPTSATTGVDAYAFMAAAGPRAHRAAAVGWAIRAADRSRGTIGLRTL